MKQLDMIKAFAKLEGVDVSVHEAFYFGEGDVESAYTKFNDEAKVPSIIRDGERLLEYNPITDLALNCAARDKYKVENDFDDESCFIYERDKFNHFEAEFNGNIPKAVIECILKSKGLWK